MVGNHRAQLEVHEDRIGRVQVLHLEFEGLVTGEGVIAVVPMARPVHAAVRREVHPVGDLVAIVVIVEGVGHAITVRVPAGISILRYTLVFLDSVVRVILVLTNAHALRALNRVNQAVVVRIGIVRVGVPPFATAQWVLKPPYLHVIADAVAVAVFSLGIGAQTENLLAIGQSVVIGVGIRRIGVHQRMLFLSFGQAVVVLVVCGGKGSGCWILDIGYCELRIADFGLRTGLITDN